MPTRILNSRPENHPRLRFALPATSSFLLVIISFRFFFSPHLFVFFSSTIILSFYTDSSLHLPVTSSIVNPGLAGSQQLSIQSSLSAENHSIVLSGTCAVILQLIRQEKQTKKKKKVCSRSFKDTFDLSLSVCVSAVRLMQPPSLSFSRSLHSFFFLPFPPSSLSFLTSFFFPNLSIVIFSPFHSLPTPTSPFSSDPRPCFSSLRKLLLVHCDY